MGNALTSSFGHALPASLLAAADGVMAVALLLIAAALVYLFRRGGERNRPARWLVTLVVIAFVAVALVHAGSALAVLMPVLGLTPVLTVTGALIALMAAIALWWLVPGFARTRQAGFETEITAHRETREALDDARLELEARVREREANETQLRLVLRELTHRSKNLLAVINAIARQTAARTTSVDEFLKRFGARLQAIGSSHDLLVADDWHGASLRMLVEQQLEAHADRFGARIAIEGDDVMLKPEAVHNLGLALHELTVNAEKFGSLSDPEGEIRIRWNFFGDAAKLKLVWQEKGGPAVEPPQRSGFGRAMIENVVGQALEGDVTLTFPPKGVRCEIVIPAAQVTSRG
jgi:two-component sensor histidine kinase